MIYCPEDRRRSILGLLPSVESLISDGPVLGGKVRGPLPVMALLQRGSVRCDPETERRERAVLLD
jgi:hypothetical protein